MAYTADGIVVEGIPVKSLETLEIRCAPGDHGYLELSGYLEEEGEAVVYGLPEHAPISVLTSEGEILFTGLITESCMKGEGDTGFLSITARTSSIQMDQKKRSRSFQNTEMTYSQLARTVLADYPGGEIMLFVPEIPIGEIAVQYRETDWQFLKRMLSQLCAVLTCKTDSPMIHLYGGVPDIPSKGWVYEKTGFCKEMGEYAYWLQQGAMVSDDSFLVTDIKTEHIPEIFEQVKEAGQIQVVKETTFRMEKGLLHILCRLQKKQGILQKREYPMHLIGTALEGTVAAVSGIQLKIHLSIDEGGTADEYWFPFSTLSASTDGSGWYYMPETGDSVRVYFPTKYTRDAIAVSAVSAYDGKEADGKPDRMGSPSTKYLSNPSGQEIKMAEDGVSLSCSGGSASVTIGNEGDITLYAANTLMIQATNDVELSAETELSLEAAQTAVVNCAMGGTIQMQPGGLLLIQGTEVKVD